MNLSKILLFAWVFITVAAFPIMLWAWFNPDPSLFGPVAVALTFTVWANLALAASTFDTVRSQRQKAQVMLAQQKARQDAKVRNRRRKNR